MGVLVTGGAGYIGSAFVKKLVEDNVNVVSIDNLFRGDYKYLSNLTSKSSVSLTVGDIRRLEDLKKIVKDKTFDAIVHLAAIPGLDLCVKNPEDAILTNVYGTYNILETARKYDVDRVIFTSSAAVYGNPTSFPIEETHPLKPTNLYGVTKLAGEKLLESYHSSYGLTTVSLRFGNVYGVGLYTLWDTVIPKFIDQALKDKPLTVFGDGVQSRDFVHIYDVVQVLLLTLKADKNIVSGEAFNIGIGRPIQVNYIISSLKKAFESLGITIKIEHLPPREGEPNSPHFCYSTVKIESKLNFKPKWNVEDGIWQIIQYKTRKNESVTPSTALE